MRSVSTRIQMKDPDDETQHIKLLHQQLHALLISFMGPNARSKQRSEAETSCWMTCEYCDCVNLHVNAGELRVELREVRLFGCCHRHIRAQHQSSPFIRGCLGLSAPPSADESSIIDQTKYIQQPCFHCFWFLQPHPEKQEGRNWLAWTKNKLINNKSVLISSTQNFYLTKNTFINAPV